MLNGAYVVTGRDLPVTMEIKQIFSRDGWALPVSGIVRIIEQTRTVDAGRKKDILQICCGYRSELYCRYASIVGQGNAEYGGT